MQAASLQGLCVLAVLATCGGAQAQASKTFNDWVVGCDNTRACTAVGMAANDGISGAISVSRDGGPGAEVKVTIITPFEWQDAKSARPVELHFDEPGFEPVVASPQNLKFDDLGVIVTVPASAVDGFVAALRKAKSLEIRASGEPKKDEEPGRVSLTGAVAALLWMDERQGRARGADALIAKGTSGVRAPAAPPTPTIARARGRATELKVKAPASVVAAWKAACEDHEFASDDKTGFQLSPDLTLWSMGCSRGAYNFGAMFFLVPRGGAPKLVRFEAPKDGKLVASEEELINGEFDPKDFTISFLSKGRGISDCGSAGRYVWDGRAFRIIAYSAMDLCRGVRPDGWPTLWRAQVK